MTQKKQINKLAKYLRKELGLDFVFAFKVAKAKLSVGETLIYDLYDEIERQSRQKIQQNSWYSEFYEEWNFETFLIGKSGKKVYL